MSQMLQSKNPCFFKVGLNFPYQTISFQFSSVSSKTSIFSIFKCKHYFYIYHPAGKYVFKVKNRNIRTRCEIYSKLTIKTPERCVWRRSGVIIVNFEHISHLVLGFLLLTLSRYASNQNVCNSYQSVFPFDISQHSTIKSIREGILF